MTLTFWLESGGAGSFACQDAAGRWKQPARAALAGATACRPETCTCTARNSRRDWIATAMGIVLLLSGRCLAQNAPDNALLEAVRLHQAGNYAGAIAGYQQFLKVHPEAVAVRSNLGAALAHEGRFSEAVREYNLALASAPQNQGIRFNLALAWYKSA